MASATGTDLDPCAPPAILENMRANGVDPDKFRVILGNMIDEQGIRDQLTRRTGLPVVMINSKSFWAI